MGLPSAPVRAVPYRALLKRGDFSDDTRDGRVVPFKLYYPEIQDGAPAPLVVWSHGFGGNRDGASFISRFLAEQGYASLHITHHGTDSSLWEGKAGHPWDILRQAKISREMTLNRMYDVPFALDAFAAWIDDHADLGAMIDQDNIAMTGHSFGAMTTQVMAGMKFPDASQALLSLKEPRFKCGITYSPVPIDHLTDAPHDEVYGAIDIPLLHMTGTDDDSPLEGHGYEKRLLPMQHANHDAQYLHLLQDGDHMVYNGTRGKLKENPNRAAHEADIQNTALLFLNAYLKDDEAAMDAIQALKRV